MIEIEHGYMLHSYDSGQLQIYKPRPYVMGDKAYAISNDGGNVWHIRIEHESYFSHDVETVGTVVSRMPMYEDVVAAVKAVDDGDDMHRFVDKW